jgi:uncharacterized RDD family membrane protein YckC
MKYASFWQRFAANWIDLFVVLIPLIALGWLGSLSKTLAMVCIIPYCLLFWCYTWQLHARTGQTVGKRGMNIRVVRVDGTRIGQVDSFRRSSVDLALALISLTVVLMGLATVPAAEFSRLGWAQQQQQIQHAYPVFNRWLFFLSQAWVWSEVIVMLFNRRRRAIHDFIGGTVVLDESGLSPDAHGDPGRALGLGHRRRLPGAVRAYAAASAVGPDRRHCRSQGSQSASREDGARPGLVRRNHGHDRHAHPGESAGIQILALITPPVWSL